MDIPSADGPPANWAKWAEPYYTKPVEPIENEEALPANWAKCTEPYHTKPV